MTSSLWGEDFEVKQVDPKVILKKAQEPKKITQVIKSSKVSVEEKIESIKNEVYRILGRYKEIVKCIRTLDEFNEYIDKSIKNDVMTIDTETNNSLDPITCKIMGLCLFTPEEKAVYIPVNHINRFTGEKLPDQITEYDIKVGLERLKENKVKTIWHNGKFDYEVLKCTCDTEMDFYWDTLIGAKLLDENESAALKSQYKLKVDPTADKYDIEHLFQGLPYEIFDPELFSLYAAMDAYKTYYLFKYQEQQFNLPGYEKLKNLFFNIEMQNIKIIAEMELAGVSIDKDYAEKLSKKYHKKIEVVENKINDVLVSYLPKIAEWRTTPEANHKELKGSSTGKKSWSKSKSEQLKDPPDLNSPLQLSILLYDVLNIPAIDKESPRGTGEEILKKIDNPLCKLILEKREIDKLLGTYIDVLPECVSKKDGKIHTSFNQIGTVTGRFSCNDPNLQNIPAKDNSIRMMFVPSDGYVFVGSDFSQQEPRLLSICSKDKKMWQSYLDDRDIYATLATGIYNNKYEDNLEHYPDGSLFEEGNKRRKAAKVFMLGISYGLGATALAEKMGKTYQEAQAIIDNFYNSFKEVGIFKKESEEFARKTGYVEDFWGRRRRLTDMLLPNFSVIKKGVSSSTFNPLLGSSGKLPDSMDEKLLFYQKSLNIESDKSKIRSLVNKAVADGYIVTDNRSKIARATRQCVNARIQGSAATMTKIALLKIANNQKLKDLGFRLLIQVHDEVIGECPEENAEEVSELLETTMKTCIKEYVDFPFKCDCVATRRWYEDHMGVEVEEFYSKELKSSGNKDESFNKTKEVYSELTDEQIIEFINTYSKKGVE